jgi:hypothetical protein
MDLPYCTETIFWIAGGWSFPALALRPFFGSPEAGVFRLFYGGGLAAPS